MNDAVDRTRLVLFATLLSAAMSPWDVRAAEFAANAVAATAAEPSASAASEPAKMSPYAKANRQRLQAGPPPHAAAHHARAAHGFGQQR